MLFFYDYSTTNSPFPSRADGCTLQYFTPLVKGRTQYRPYKSDRGLTFVAQTVDSLLLGGLLHTFRGELVPLSAFVCPVQRSQPLVLSRCRQYTFTGQVPHPPAVHPRNTVSLTSNHH